MRLRRACHGPCWSGAANAGNGGDTVVGWCDAEGRTAIPGDMAKVSRIRDALNALGGGDRKQAIEFVKIAMLN